ncbi:MAG: type II toxin-antitoxin system RelE/ParE family toxin [Motiliproteus sp.]
MPIKSFKHKGLKDFFENDTVKGIDPKHVKRLTKLLDRLDASLSPKDMNLPAFRLHKLEPKAAETWSVSVSGA